MGYVSQHEGALSATFTNKDEVKVEKKKDGKKNILQGPVWSKGPTDFSVSGERAILAEPLRSRCCFLIGNSVSNKAFHLLSLVKCFHSISK